MSLDNYSISVAGLSRTFAQMGISSAKIVSLSGGGDYAEFTVPAKVTAAGMPFLPLQRHDLFTPGGELVFTGWLLQPSIDGTGGRQEQTFRLDGPMSRLAGKTYKEDWQFATDPTSYTSALAPKKISRLILNEAGNRNNDGIFQTGPAEPTAHRNVREQVALILGYAAAHGAGVAIAADLAAIPTIEPHEDEQQDANCEALLKRQLRLVPKVTPWWRYSTGIPTLFFSANDAVPVDAISVGTGVVIRPGAAIASAPGSGGIVIDLAGGRIKNFKGKARYDLLVGKVTVALMGERTVKGTTDDDAPINWVTYAEDVSTVQNGSDREMCFAINLRGGSGAFNTATGTYRTSGEPFPVDLASKLHDPFKTLSYSLSWDLQANDVDWATVPGQTVGVRNAGDAALAGARAIIQQISRNLATRTTSYQAGPLPHLSLRDYEQQMRLNKTANAARHSGGGGGGGGGSGRDRKKNGKNDSPPAKPPSGGGGGGGGGGANGDGSYGTCADDRRADNFYGNSLIMPCGVLDGAMTRVKLDLDDLAGTSAPVDAVVKFREVDCLYNGASGKQIAVVSDGYASTGG